ncbi:hypothetical protein B0T25DRAFT_226522 [Lasiosphaeria hispida]|uniref:Uncharacterized protein n=1 Tax=Lasiosphaeria hispida TaxID=260671 RepID=A0AAJ0HD11_9PEZI|nr:hypothetical protein B0T25DRAFT_226522 [Lasiosphaeria hispida]
MERETLSCRRLWFFSFGKDETRHECRRDEQNGGVFFGHHRMPGCLVLVLLADDVDGKRGTQGVDGTEGTEKCACRPGSHFLSWWRAVDGRFGRGSMLELVWCIAYQGIPVALNQFNWLSTTFLTTFSLGRNILPLPRLDRRSCLGGRRLDICSNCCASRFSLCPANGAKGDAASSLFGALAQMFFLADSAKTQAITLDWKFSPP